MSYFFLIFFNLLDNSGSLVEVTQNIVQMETTSLHKHIKAKRRKCKYGFFFWFLYSLCVFQVSLGKLRFDDANDAALTICQNTDKHCTFLYWLS